MANSSQFELCPESPRPPLRGVLPPCSHKEEQKSRESSNRRWSARPRVTMTSLIAIGTPPAAATGSLPPPSGRSAQPCASALSSHSVQKRAQSPDLLSECAHSNHRPAPSPSFDLRYRVADRFNRQPRASPLFSLPAISFFAIIALSSQSPLALQKMSRPYPEHSSPNVCRQRLAHASCTSSRMDVRANAAPLRDSSTP